MSVTRRNAHRKPLAALMAAAAPMVGAQAAEDLTLAPIDVTSEADTQSYRVTTSANSKMTEPLLDTPKTVQVISQQVIREQGANSLMEALRNTPGITLQMGENGNTALGDTFTMRGFSTQNSIFVDGIRDLGAVSRDIFNLEQIEVIKGPSGSDSGRGSASGYINLISKLPSLEDRINLSTSYGTADQKILSADINQQLGEGSAARLNLVRRDGGVDGRDVVENTNFGVAPSLAFGLDGDTRVFLYSQHVRQENIPDGGIPALGLSGYYNANPVLNAAPKVDRENFYGFTSDYEDVQADMVTFKVEHDLNDVTTVRNLTRWGRSTVERVLTGAFSNLNPVDPNNPGTWTVGRSRQYSDQSNKVLANQTSLNTEFDTFGLRNTLAAGLELAREQFEQVPARNATVVVNGPLPANIYHPDPQDRPIGHVYKNGAKNESETETAAVYVFDTLHLNEQWSVNAGLRFENYRVDYRGIDAAGVVTKTNASDDLFSWNAGVVYKPLPNGSIYLAYANSLTPPSGGSTAANSADNPNYDPQETRHVELGTKWDLLDERLSLALAAYRTENENQVSYDEVTGTYDQEGKLRVDGVELTAVGRLSDNWQVTAGISHMKTKQMDQASIDRNGVVTQSTGVRWSPEWSATLWTTYNLGRLTLGGGARYIGEQDRQVARGATINPATVAMPSVPSYWVADAMASYQVNDNLAVRLNVYNLLDEEYYELNNGGTRIRYGQPRSALLTADLSF